MWFESCKPKLEQWLKDFHFIDLNNAVNNVDWSIAQTVNLNEIKHNEKHNDDSRRTAQLHENSPNYTRY